jgi:tetratricopeptide (TPR) repeat protein
MNTSIFKIILVLGVAAASSGCSLQKAAEVGTAARITDADPDTAAALKMIDKAPDSPVGYNALAVHYLKKVRQTADFSYATKAETAIDKALAADPKDPIARKLKASVHLSFHRFDEAIAAANELLAESPNDPYLYGVLTDANMELGNYDAAVKAAQKMVDMRPETASFARVAQLRTLHGDHTGALEIMKQAARSADPLDKETQSWCLVQMGDEMWKSGSYADAERVYDEALGNFPDYYLAIAAKGKIRAAQGDLASAEKFLTDAQNRVPNVDVIILLAQVYSQLGNTEKADQQAKLLEVVEEKLGQAGDQKRLALFWADRGVRIDEALAIAEREHAARKDIYSADVYAWCLMKAGRTAEARTIMDEALRLKTKDARLLYHAGMIAAALGDKSSAKKNLSAALKLNPAFDLIQAQKARAELANLVL